MTLPLLVLTIIPMIFLPLTDGFVFELLRYILCVNAIIAGSDIINSILIAVKPSNVKFCGGYYIDSRNTRKWIKRIVRIIFAFTWKRCSGNVRAYAFIENVVTHEDYRGKGYASECLAYAKELAQKENCYKMMLLTGSKKESTMQFYKRAGYNSSDKTAFIQWIQ